MVYADTRLGQMHLRIWPGPADAVAPPVVCLHPVPYSGAYYDAFASLLSQRLSVAGCGYAGLWQFGKTACAGQHRRACRGYCRRFADTGYRPVCPSGFHTGSAIAVELAIARAKRVPKLVCITYPLLDEEQRKDQLASLGRVSQAGEQLDSLRRRWRFTVTNRAAGVPLDAAMTNFIDELRAGDDAWFGFQSMFEYPSEERLPKLKQTALVINVEGSLKAATQAAAELIPEARYVEFPSMNKGIFELHARQLASAVSAFVEGSDD